MQFGRTELLVVACLLFILLGRYLPTMFRRLRY